MRIVRPYARMMVGPLCDVEHAEYLAGSTDPFTKSHGLKLLQHVEWCARISHRSEEAMTNDSWRRILSEVVLKHGDWSVVEHAVVSVDAYVDRGITHEWVRHRIASYTQESTRFVNYEKKMPPSFIYPKVDVECEACLSGNQPEPRQDYGYERWQHFTPAHPHIACAYDVTWLDTIAQCEFAYQQKIKDGWRPQEARSVFPNALASRIISTENLRSWRHFFIMRTTLEAHPQMRQVTIPLLKEFQEKIPLFFDDIVPLTKQSESMARVR